MLRSLATYRTTRRHRRDETLPRAIRMRGEYEADRKIPGGRGEALLAARARTALRCGESALRRRRARRASSWCKIAQLDPRAPRASLSCGFDDTQNGLSVRENVPDRAVRWEDSLPSDDRRIGLRAGTGQRQRQTATESVHCAVVCAQGSLLEPLLESMTFFASWPVRVLVCREHGLSLAGQRERDRPKRPRACAGAWLQPDTARLLCLITRALMHP
eukprot:5029328-Pleurochrysis_carterae.AAC.2